MSMEHQLGATEKLPDSPKTIWLAPACNVDERTWCVDDIGACDECSEPSVKYRRADLVDAEIRKLRAAIRNMLDALDCNDEIAAYAYAKTALGNEQRVAEEGG